MIKTTDVELGDAYLRANRIIMAMNPVTPKIMGALWRNHFGLHHRHKKDFWTGEVTLWVEFPDDRDYTAFMLRFA